jgi:hypothetical protein
LVGVSIPVADEDVHQAGAEVRLSVDAVRGVVLEPLQEPGRSHDPRRSSEARRVVVSLVRPDLDPADQAREVVPVFTEARVVGQDDEGGRGMEDSGRVQQGRDHHRTQGKQRRYAVLHHRGGDGSA